MRKNDPESVVRRERARYTRDRDKRIASVKGYYLKNQDKIKEQKKKRNRDNPEYKEWQKDYYLINKDKIREKNKRWRLQNKEKLKSKRLKDVYGITLEDYQNLLIKQKRKCSICLKEFDNLVIDHCHTTGKVRELLCDTCNKAIGLLYENEEYFLNAIEYLRRHK